MATIHDNALDAGLDYIADNGTHLHVVSDGSDPANVTNTLGNVALTTGDGNGDFTIGNGDTSGRKLTLASQSITASGTGTATRWVIWDNSNSVVLACDTITSKSLTNGSTYEFPEFDVCELRDAASE